MATDPSMPILIVDDYAIMRRILQSQLSELGFTNMTEAQDGRAALALIQDHKFSLILSDWHMEPMGGLEFVRKVRLLPSYEQTPIIMITAESKANYVVEAYKVGVAHYLIKPFTAQALKTKIEQAIRQPSSLKQTA